MKVSIVLPRELDTNDLAVWASIQGADPQLASPYFCPEFALAAASVRDDVRVAVIEAGGKVAAFLPFQRGRFGIGTPVGGRLSDFHGLIAVPNFECSATDLLKQCGLVSWGFHHLLASQVQFRKFHVSTALSHFMDLADGFQGYVDRLEQAGSGLLKDVQAKRRKMEKQFGPVRFEAQVSDSRVLEKLFAWKSRQYQHSGLVDVFSFDWTKQLLRHIHQCQTPSFAGMLSAIYAGDDLVAVHMGMRSAKVWNWWFPRHDERFQKLSPGIMLRICAAEHAHVMGIDRIDLGIGDEATYKPRLSSGGIPLCEGYIERCTPVTLARTYWRAAEAWVRRTPLVGIARVPGRLLKNIERRNAFR